MRSHIDAPAWVTPLVPEPVGLGGRIRVHDEDFLVEELPLVRPSGRGHHVLFQIEKRGMSTFDALLRVSKGAKVSEHKIGYAGLKDARAVARQYMTAHRVPPERILGIRHPKMRVLSAVRHGGHLRLGYHRGNRFTIRIRGIRREAIPAARRALERYAAQGMPNAYGGQRFGVRQDGHLMGRAVVDEDWGTFLRHLLGAPSPLEGNPKMIAAREAYDAGDLEKALGLYPLKHRVEKKAAASLLRGGSPRGAFLALGQRSRKIWVAAWQSYLFNRILDRRIVLGTFDRVVEGDIAAMNGSLACFPIRAGDEEEASRVACPTGPLVGYDLPLADGVPGEIERDVFRTEGAEAEAFRSDHVRARGHRRPLRVPVQEASLTDEGDGSVVLRFLLPPGSFATVLLEGLMAGPPAPSADPGPSGDPARAGDPPG